MRTQHVRRTLLRPAPRSVSPSPLALTAFVVSSICFVATTSTSSSLTSSSSLPASSAASKLYTLGSSTAYDSNAVVSSGLANCGNTCYLSAQIQCAFHIPRVRSLVLGLNDPARTQARSSSSSSLNPNCAADRSSSDPSDSETTQSSAPASIALQSLRQLFQDMVMASASHLVSKAGVISSATSPASFCRALGIPVLEQQDSQEFWKLLLPAINLQPLTDLYQGAFEDYIVALDGSGRERRREEAFLDLSLDVHSTEASGGDGSGSSVMDSLRSLFGKPELLSASDGNGWRPEKGADPVDAHKGSTLKAQGLPPVLQLHLKRFQYDWNTDTTRKINDPVLFPLTLDLSELCQNKKENSTDSSVTSDDDSLTYDLQAIVVHAGEYGSGHYYAYVRPDVRGDNWYRFNDHLVDAVSYRDVYADARGGKAPMDAAIHDNDSTASSKRPGWFGRLWGMVGRAASKDPYGYGGRTSNAYVLQYVKRSDVPLLYDT